MNKGIKITLNVLSGLGLAAGGYFIGLKRGKKIKETWALEQVNNVIQYYEDHREVKIKEKIAEPETLSNDILEQLEYGKEDEIEVPFDLEEEEEEPEPEPAPKKKAEPKAKPKAVKEEPKKPAKPKSKKAPYFIDYDQYATSKFEEVFLELDEDGDLYQDESDDLFTERDLVGETNIKKMLLSFKNGDGDEWWICNEPNTIVYDIVFRHKK